MEVNKSVLVIGASGGIGKILMPQLAAAKCNVVAMVRDKSRYVVPDASKEFIRVVEGDLEESFESAMEGCDRVIFSAGSGAGTGFDKTLLIDLWAASKAIDFAKKKRIKQFIMISSRGADNPEKGPLRIKPYLIAKHFADQHLIQSGVPYTILQPGRLVEQGRTGLITTVRPSDPKEQIISREDTAEVIKCCLDNVAFLNKTIELFNGQDKIREVFS